MNIDISDLENFVHIHNPRIRINDQGCELLASYKLNYEISHVVDTENDVAFVHLAKSFYFPHGRIRVLQPFNGDHHSVIPVTIKLPANISKVVVGEDYYRCSGIFVNKEDDAYLIPGYNTKKNKRILLVSPNDSVNIFDIVSKIPNRDLPVTSSLVKSGQIIFREFPVPWPRERLVLEEIQYDNDKGKKVYINLRNNCLEIKQF